MQQPMTAQQHPNVPSPKKRGIASSQIIMALALFGVAALAIVMLVLVGFSGANSSKTAIKKEQYQAVFLNSQDGQVYFGKLEEFNQTYYKLTDIFYVRVEQRIQPEGQNASQQTQQNISLAKLGNELHGPEDEMYISRDKVLFWENLKEEGQVVKAIREYKKNPNAANTQNTNTNSTQQSAGNGNSAAGTNEANTQNSNTNDTPTP